MSTLRFTLVSDGSSDTVLIPLLEWLLGQHSNRLWQGAWADLARLPKPPRGLSERITIAIDLYPCNLLVVHRDAERDPPGVRTDEIRTAIRSLRESPPALLVVPVRMQEAWFLFDERSIRRAAGNPNGNDELELPALAAVEQLPSPKDVLHNLLRKASGLSGRRLKNFSARQAVHRLAESISDYSPLRQVPAFQDLEGELSDLLQGQSWD